MLRAMQKALKRFADEYVRQREDALKKAHASVDAASEALQRLEISVARVAAIGEQIGALKAEVAQARAPELEPDAIEDRSQKMSLAIRSLGDQISQTLRDVGAAAVSTETEKAVLLEKARTAAERDRARDAEKKLILLRRRQLGVVSAAGLVAGVLGIAAGALAMRTSDGDTQRSRPTAAGDATSSSAPSVETTAERRLARGAGTGTASGAGSNTAASASSDPRVATSDDADAAVGSGTSVETGTLASAAPVATAGNGAAKTTTKSKAEGPRPTATVKTKDVGSSFD